MSAKVEDHSIRPPFADSVIVPAAVPAPEHVPLHRAHITRTKRRILLAAPPLVIAATYAAFQGGIALLGPSEGHVAGFVFYWLLVGLALPVFILGAPVAVELFGPGRAGRTIPPMVAIVFMAALPLFGFLFVFPTSFPSTEERVLIAVAGYALINAPLEEAFWRGTFARAFPRDAVRGFLYPAVAFGVWHLVPMSLYETWPPGGPIAVFAVGTGVGMLYGWVAWRTGSVRWTALSHALVNLSGIGAMWIFAPLL